MPGSDLGIKKLKNKLNSLLVKSQSLNPLNLRKKKPLIRKSFVPQSIKQFQRSTHRLASNMPTKTRFEGFLRFLDALNYKRTWIYGSNRSSEEGLKRTPLPIFLAKRKPLRNAMANQKLPSFIPLQSSQNPFYT